MTVGDKISKRNIQAVTVATLIIVLAIAALLIGMTDASWTVALYVVLLGLGLILIIRSFVLPNEWDFAGPNASDISIALGVIILMAGVIGMISVYLTSNAWVLAAVFLIAVALVILMMVMRNKKR